MPPMLEYDNGLEDDFGLIHIQGSSNSLIANHISETIEQQYLKPAGVKPIIILWCPEEKIILQTIILWQLQKWIKKK